MTAHFIIKTGRPSVASLVNMIVMQLEMAGVLPSPWGAFAMNGEKYMEISEETFDVANRRAAAARAAFPAVVSVKYDRRIARIVIALSSGLELAFSPKSAQGLENAHPAELMDVEITPSGLGVHFPRLDADLYIPALLEGFLGSKRWMASVIGKTGGTASTEAKVAAARQNGKLGGRPKKSKGLIAA